MIRVEQELKHIYFTNLSGTFGFEFLFSFFMASSIFMVIMVYLGIALQIDLPIAIESLRSLFMTVRWNVVYGVEYDFYTISTLTSSFY